MNISRGIRRARECAGLTVEEMAKRIGWPEDFVRHAEAGESYVINSARDLYAKTLGFPVELIGLLGADPEDLRGITPESAAKLAEELAAVVLERKAERSEPGLQG